MRLPTNWLRQPSYWRLLRPYWTKINIYEGPERFHNDLENAPAYIRTLFATHWLYSEFLNGGFGQFFDNSTGVLAPEASEGFDQLGMPLAAAFVRSRMLLFGESYPRDRGVRQASMFSQDGEAVEDHFQTLSTSVEDEFESLLRTENGGFVASANRYADRFLK